ncbi:MAG: ATPase, T2SS/T4P/T4SS family, partial [Acidimicrobiales bacterium]
MAVVARVHAAVGETLTQRHASDEAAHRLRLSPSDERALSHKLIGDELQKLAAGALTAGRVPLTDEQEEELVSAVLDRLHGLGRLQPLLDDPEIRDIHIPGAERTWLQLRDGSKVRGPAIADSGEELVELIATAARRVGRSERRWDNAHAELNLRLPNGDRLHALMAVTGRPTVTIRRHDFAIHRVSQLVDLGLVDTAIGAFLTAAVRAKFSLIVAGGTGTGKTTTLRCLINEIPADERLITI